MFLRTLHLYFRNLAPVNVALSFVACHGIGEAFREGDEITNGGVASVGVDDDFTCVVHHAPEAIELIPQIYYIRPLFPVW